MTTRQIDGRRLFARAVGFGRALRKSGLAVDLGAAIDFARALEVVDIGDREQVRAAGEAVFVRRKDDLEPYSVTFDRYWRGRFDLGSAEGLLADPWEELVPADSQETGDEPPMAGDERMEQGEDQSGMPVPGDHDESSEEGDPDALSISPDAYSKLEALRHREFDRMTPAELRDAERLVDLLVPKLERRRTRRYELHPHGRRIAPRAMFRQNLATGGEITRWVWRRPIKRPRPLVVICDISGSMERHSRLLLRFVQALSAASAVKTESFVFGTRLTRVTRLLRDRDRDRALAKVADSVTDWAGGTRIGESFHEFNVEVGAAHAPHERRGHRGVRRLGSRRSGAGGRRGRSPPSQLPPPHLAESAGRHGRLPAARRRDARRLPVHRRLPGRGYGRQPGAARRGPRWRAGGRRPTRQRGRGPCLAGPAVGAARARGGPRRRAGRDRERRGSAGGATDHVAGLAPVAARIA